MPIPVFNEELHRYTTPAGERLPGVTSILGEYIRVERLNVAVHSLTGNTIPLPVLDAAAEYGRAAHKILELSTLHGVDSFDAPESMQNAVRQIRQFIEDYAPQPVMCEQPLYSEKHRYAGTSDLVFISHRIRNGKRLCLLDAKSGQAGQLTGPQTAAYEDLYREETGEKGLIDRFKLQLPKGGGDYRLIPLKNPGDRQYFYYKLFCHRYVATL